MDAFPEDMVIFPLIIYATNQGLGVVGLSDFYSAIITLIPDFSILFTVSLLTSPSVII